MRVKFVRSIASSTWSFAAGREYDLRDDVARKWIRQGFAKPVQVQETALAAVEPEMAARTIPTIPRAHIEAHLVAAEEVVAEALAHNDTAEAPADEEGAAEAEAPFEEPEPEKKPEKKTPARGRRRAAPAQESTTKNSESAADPT